MTQATSDVLGAFVDAQEFGARGVPRQLEALVDPFAGWSSWHQLVN